MATTCHLCNTNISANLVSLGAQAVCNRFLPRPDAAETRFNIDLAQCPHCGLVQIGEPIPPEELIPPYPWITYNEPEGHLDALADSIAALPGVSATSAIWGISGKDDSLLARLAARGLKNIRRLSPADDLDIVPPNAGVETIQARLTAERAGVLASRLGRPAVIIARHILEHAHNLREFLDALQTTIAPGGYLVLESPGCENMFARCDYSSIWEEHVSYFTAATFQQTFARMEQTIVSFEAIPGEVENLLIGIGQARGGNLPRRPQMATRIDHISLDAFSKNLPACRKQVGELLALHRRRGPVAILGAGHASCMFLNLMEAGQFVSFVADDNPHKQGLFMPGSHLPILPASALAGRGVHLCLLGVPPSSEDKVIDRNRPFVQRGGLFASIFPASKRPLADLARTP